MSFPLSFSMEKLERWQLAYIAGIVDGEGSISLSIRKNQKSIAPLISVDMVTTECINYLHSTTGIGRVFHVHRLHKPSHYKQSYAWQVGGRLEIYLLLRALQPYLIVKREQAIVMLEFVERRIQDRLVTGRDFELLTEMHKLNS